MVQTKRLQVTLGRLTIRSQDPRTLGETRLKNTCGTGTTSAGSWGWNTAHVCSCSKCRRHLLHFRLSPSASAAISHSSRCSQALGTLAWPSHAVGPAPKEQQGGTAEISPFLSIWDFFCLYLFPKWGFIFKRSVSIKLNPQLQLCTAASCQSHKLLHKSVFPAKPRAHEFEDFRRQNLCSTNFSMLMVDAAATGHSQAPLLCHQISKKKEVEQLEKVQRITRITIEREILPQNKSKEEKKKPMYSAYQRGNKCRTWMFLSNENRE